VADSQRMRHVSMVMSTAQAARIMGNLKTAAGKPQDTNILQGWLKRKGEKQKESCLFYIC
jgi:hypothetical protein